MSTRRRLDRWYATDGRAFGDERSPGRGVVHLVGYVSGDPRWPDGERVETSRVVACEGRVARTGSGTEYELGEPDSDWVAWMARKGIAFDPEKPIRFVGALTPWWEGSAPN